DVFLFLQNAQKKKTQWDYVICDPPSFARSADQRKGAEKAYRKLMTQALGVVRPGGYFCAASCTSQIGPAHFRRILAEASRAARLRLQIVHEVGQPFDHPVAIGHEEGRYLKFIEVRVLARV
ncbi:MAG: class I SAM-dependent rRNA methyltransferase, partial [Polyangiaceae bacterium]|nr:class I SAM-dependent rRNA methyltransferase [Polyangiaceae bacterium]